MIMHDMRLPLIFGRLADVGPDDAVLFEGGAQGWNGAAASFTPLASHAPGCACCATRTQAGHALARLLHDRARNQVVFFRRVVAVVETEQGRAEIETALANDPVVSSCFRPGSDDGGSRR